jgi:HEAT repeat protein
MFGPLFYTTATIAVLLFGAQGLSGLAEMWRARNQFSSQVEGLSDPIPGIRIRSLAQILERSPEVAMPYILAATRDPKVEVRASAIQSLINARTDVPAMKTLLGAAQDRQVEIRLAAAEALGRLPMTISALLESRKEDFDSWRRQSLAALLKLSTDSNADVRRMAVDALKNYGDGAESIKALTAATDDTDRGVRFDAARALMLLRGPNDPAAVGTLLKMIADPEPIAERQEIVELLQPTEDSVAREAVQGLIGLLSVEDSLIYKDVISCIAQFGDQARAALPKLEKLMKDENLGLHVDSGMAIVSILGEADEQSIEILLGILVDDRVAPEARESAVDMVFGTKPKELAKATPALIRQLGSENQNTRITAHSLLSRIVEEMPAEMPGTADVK